MRRLRPLLSLGIVALALALSACTAFDELIQYASLSANGTVVQSVDGTARPAATGASAAGAIAARTITINAMTKEITLVANEKVELDLTGSWMAYQPKTGAPQWVCPARASASFWSREADAEGPAAVFSSAAVKSAVTQLSVDIPAAVALPFVSGKRCLNGFRGLKVTATAPQCNASIAEVHLDLKAYSGGERFYYSYFEPPTYTVGSKGVLVPVPGAFVEGPRRVVGQSSLIAVDLRRSDGTSCQEKVKVPAPAPRTTGLYFTLNPGASADRRDIARATLDGATVNPAFVNAVANASSVAVRGAYLYWSTDTAIGRAKLDGTSVEPSFISGLSDVRDIAVTDQYIFWIRDGSSASIGRADIGGANANETWFPSPTDPNFPALEYIAANASHVYFATASFGGAGSLYHFIRRVSVTNPADVTNLPGGVGATQGYFAVDDAYLYASGAYSNAGGMGAGIGRMALSTATTVGLSELVYRFPDGYTADRGVAVDGTHLYWVSRHDSSTTYFLSRANADGTNADVTWLPLSVVPGSLAVSSATARRGLARGGGQASGASQRGSAARTTGYAATTSMRMLKSTVLVQGRSSKTNGPLAGAVVGGSYRWATPARVSGTARPRGLAAFTRGRYVARVTRLAMMGGATDQVGVGSGYMLLRGSSVQDLLCLEVLSDGIRQQTAIVGGRGAGAAVRGELRGDALRVPFDALGVVTTGSGASRRPEIAQVEPFANVMTLAASTGKARKMPKACRALVDHLPTPNPTPNPTPTPVTG